MHQHSSQRIVILGSQCLFHASDCGVLSSLARSERLCNSNQCGVGKERERCGLRFEK